MPPGTDHIRLCPHAVSAPLRRRLPGRQAVACVDGGGPGDTAGHAGRARARTAGEGSAAETPSGGRLRRRPAAVRR